MFLRSAEIVIVARNQMLRQAPNRGRVHRPPWRAKIRVMSNIAYKAAAPADDPARRERWRGGEALRTARTCYDHLAGRLGVALAESLARSGYVTLASGEVTGSGHSFLDDFGVQPLPGKRVLCRPCLDWSERRPHIAGRLGAALATRCLELDWVERQEGSRVLTVTPAGESGFAERFGIRFWG
jgi:hypothetical protein